jgi:hypothetical protein
MAHGDRSDAASPLCQLLDKVIHGGLTAPPQNFQNIAPGLLHRVR